ncbi:MAG: EF-hand domain-containing protein [Rhodospirillaceae bacterium]|nr:EF-hand domain-containing protein [Rhodospirillales bacterium]
MRALAPLAACLILANASLALGAAGDQPPATGQPPAAGQPQSGMGPRMMMDMDADKDGVVTREEFLAAHSRADVRFAQLDVNKDGSITRDEWLAEPAGANRANRFKQLDTNGDGRITHTELDASRNARFDAMDSDHDGKLATSEMRGGPMMPQQSQLPD